MTEAQHPVGIALAGGSSKRMGRDKTRLRLDNLTLAERAIQVLSTVCRDVAIADRGRQTVAHSRSLEDGPGKGPAAGILGAARVFPERPLLILACDLPFVPRFLLQRLAAAPESCDLFVPSWNHGLEPLCALYGSRALRHLERQVTEGDFSLQPLLRSTALAIDRLEGEELTKMGLPERIFANINSPADAAKIGLQLPDIPLR